MDLGFPIEQYLGHFVVADAVLIVALLGYLWLKGRIDRRRLASVQAQRFTGRPVRDGGVLRRAGRPLRDNQIRQNASGPQTSGDRTPASAFGPAQRYPGQPRRSPSGAATVPAQFDHADMMARSEDPEDQVVLVERGGAQATAGDAGLISSQFQQAGQEAQPVDPETKAVADACAKRLLDLASELEKQKEAVAEFIATGEALDLERLNSLRTYRSVIIQTDKDKLHLLRDLIANDINDVYVEVAEWDSAFDRLLEMAHQQPLEPAWSEVIEKKLTSTISKMEEVIAELTTSSGATAAVH